MRDLPTPPDEIADGVHRRDHHGLRSIVVDRRVRPDRAGLLGPTPRDERRVQLRLVVDTCHPDHPGCTGRRVRGGGHHHDADGLRGPADARGTDRVRHEPPRDRDQTRKPRPREVAGRPEPPRHDRVVRRRGAVREVCEPGPAIGRRHHRRDQDHPGRGRDGDPRRRHHRRRRCGDRVRHRREARRCRDHGCPDSRSTERDRLVPHRRAHHR